jgi:PAS domain S-box-containing protein
MLTLQAFITVMSVMAGMVAADALVRRRTETALVRSEQRYRELFERNPQPAFVCDRKSGSIVAANAAAMQVYGYSYTDLLSRKFSKLQVRQMAGRPGEPTSDALPPGPKQEEQHLRADGTVLDAEVTRYDLLLEQGPATVLVCADVTQKRRSQKRVKLFSDLGQRLSVARTQSNAAWIIVDTADRLFGWDACTFSLVGPQEGRVEIVLSADIIDGRRTELPPASEVPGPVIRKILTEGSQLLVRPASGEFPAEALPFGDVKRPSATIMGVPIRKEETVLGILTIQSYTHNAYSLEDLEVLQAVADHCAGALERIRAEEENERLNLELRRHLDQLQTLLAVAPVGIAVAQDPECRVVSGNETWCRLLGVKSPTDLSASTRGENVQPEMLKQGKTLPLEEWPIRRAARDQVSIIGEEVEVRLSNDRVASYYAYASPLFDETGKVRGCLSILVDLTERKRAEQEVLRLNAELERRVRERTLQLEVINKELEAFSYSVSHDLRAPLRSIRGFSEILLEKYGPQLDEGGREYLNRACASCVHMDKLIEDLLKLSRVGRSELQRQQVNLSRMAEEIGTELQRADPDRRVTLAVTPGLKVEGDERLLRVAMENLLRNAWKFTRDQPEPRVEFGVREGGERAFYVKDNGAGFNPAYAGKLFGVFQRLHTVSEFPGTGVGLATVQRVIVRHGGRTWATGQVKEGACFYFTLPANRN